MKLSRDELDVLKHYESDVQRIIDEMINEDVAFELAIDVVKSLQRARQLLTTTINAALTTNP